MTHDISFVCEYCGETLETSFTGGFFTYDKYHECNGGRVGTVAILNPTDITIIEENFEIEVT